MKNKVAILLTIIFTCLLAGCIDKNSHDDIKVIDADFIISENIKSNYLYQHSSKLIIEGECEAGVHLYANLYSKRGISTSSDSCVVLEDGTYKLELETPNGSFDEYKLVVKDYHEKYVHEYTNLLFGEINLLLGDTLINEFDIEIDEFNLENIYVLDATLNNHEWLVVKNKEQLTSFMYYLSSIYKDTSKYKNMPIGFVNVLYDRTFIEEWLSLESINNSNNLVKNFLMENGKYYETPYHKGQMSYIYNNVLLNLKNISFGNIIYSAGINEFEKFYSKIDSQDAYTNYSRMLLMNLKGITELISSYNNLSIIQAPSKDTNNLNILRSIFTKVVNRIDNAYLIPTYDLKTSENSSFYEKLAIRFYDITIGKKEVSQYANYYITLDSSTLTIEFSNTNRLISKDVNLKLYDINNNLIEIEEDKIDLYYNKIIIDLSYEVELFDKELGDIVTSTNYYEVSSVSYCDESNIESGIIYNNNNLPIIPFTIILIETEEVKYNE